MNYIINESNITLMVDGEPIQVIRGNASFPKVRKAILEGDMELAVELAVASREIKNTIEASSENVTVRDGEVFYRDHVVDMVVTKTLIGMINEGLTDVQPWINHIEKLMQNPNNQSRTELYDFLSYKGLPIADDGCVYAYKGVNIDFWSTTGNPKTIVLQGETNSSGQILNTVGSVIEVDRGSVDGDRRKGCSNGLHVGSFDYARGWGGGKLLLVKFDPKDAVSVPTDSCFQKLRVCKYEVVKDITKESEEITRSLYSSDPIDIKREIESEINAFLCETEIDIEEYKSCDELIDDLETYGYLTSDWTADIVNEVFESMSPQAGQSGRDKDMKEGLKRIGLTENCLRIKLMRYEGRGLSVKDIQKNLKVKGLNCEVIAYFAEVFGLRVSTQGVPWKSQWLVL